MNNSIPKKVGRFPAAPSSPVNLSGVAQRALKQARASTIGKDKAAQAWDDKISHADKKIILLAAQLPESFAKKEWESLTTTQHKHIYQATYRLSRWASALGIVADSVAEVAA